MRNSPFPGMDPYLEPHWRDIHTKLVAYTADAMNTRLPDDLAAESEEYVSVEADEDTDGYTGGVVGKRQYQPDVRVVEPDPERSGASSPPSGIAVVPAPVRLLLHVEPATERTVRIVETTGGRVVTVIEFVCPSNKRGKDMADLRRKREKFLEAGVNVVEVDLVRSGNWRALLRPHSCPDQWDTAYRVTVRVPTDPVAVGLYPIPLRERLPSVVVPLRPTDPEVRLELQPLIDQSYINGRYGRRLDYATPPEPPLTKDDAEWAAERIGASE